MERPNDRRGFVHKKILGAISTVSGILPIPGGNLISKVTGFLGGRVRGRGQPSFPVGIAEVPGTTLVPGGPAIQPLNPTTSTPFSPPIPGIGGGFPVLTAGPNGSPCRPNESSRCCTLRNGSFSDQAQWQRECGVAGNGAAGPDAFGNAVMGQFGAALEPGVRMTDTRVCPRGTVLGMDGLCYNKRDIRNSERAWPTGTKPLLTGGEMRCIRIAAGAGRKMDRKVKQLRKMGMMKPLPSPRKTKALPGHHAHVAHD